MWDLPRPGLEPMSPALAGGFSTTAPPGKPQVADFISKHHPLKTVTPIFFQRTSLTPAKAFKNNEVN